jgi:hypothetical protein
MPTEELEQELRSVFARAAAEFQNPAQARQRVLQHNYRPGSRRLLATCITAVAVAGSVLLGLGLSGVLSAVPTRSTGTIRTVAFTLIHNADGTATLTVRNSQMIDPATLQRALKQDGIPALVKTNTHCSANPLPPGVLSIQLPDGTPVPGPSSHPTPIPANAVLVINPAAIPTGTELYFGYFNSGLGYAFQPGLVYTSFYTCGPAGL